MKGHVAVIALALALVAAACGGDGDDEKTTGSSSSTSSTAAETTTTVSPATTTGGSTATTTRTTTRPAAPGAPAATTTTPTGPPVAIKLTRIATLSEPLALAQAPDDDALYVAEQGGRVRAIRNGQVAETVLDVTTLTSGGGEQGLLGVAFSNQRRVIVVNYTDDDDGDTHVVEYPFAGGRVTGGARELLRVDQPYSNHNGGNVVFGPDGRLYVGLGDGGSGGDPQNRAQNPNERLGKMLRIDTATAQVEMWMLGLRNPWRYSFDRATGDMWIGDVGQGLWEEIDFAPAGTRGQNWGWARREGKHAYNGGAAPAGNVDPIYEYGHEGAVCAVTGGYAYRGSRLRGWGGVYFFADYCVGRVMALTRNGSQVSVRDTGLSTSQLTSFGEDRNGELYVLSGGGPVYRIDPA